MGAAVDDHDEFGLTDARLKILETSDARVPILVKHMLEGRDYLEIAGLMKLTTRAVWLIRKRYGLDEYVQRCNAEALQGAANAYASATKKTFQRLVEMLDSPSKDDHRFAIEVMRHFIMKRGDVQSMNAPAAAPAPLAPPEQPAARLPSAELISRAKQLVGRTDR